MHSFASILLSLNIAAAALWTKNVRRVGSVEVPYIHVVRGSLSRMFRFSSTRRQLYNHHWTIGCIHGFFRFSTIVLSRFFLNLRAAASPMPTSHIFTQAAQEFSFSLRFGIGEETDNEGESYTGELEHDEEAEHDIDILP